MVGLSSIGTINEELNNTKLIKKWIRSWLPEVEGLAKSSDLQDFSAGGHIDDFLVRLGGPNIGPTKIQFT